MWGLGLRVSDAQRALFHNLKGPKDLIVWAEGFL